MAGKCIAMVCMALLVSFGVGAGEAAKELQRGFSVAHDASYAQFQPVLSDPTGVFAMGFLRINSTMLDLAVLHLPSAFALWRAIPDWPAPWSAAVSLSFNGSLLLTDGATNQVLWSSTVATAGDRAVLVNTSNLQIRSDSAPGDGVVWQSFDYPSDTIVQGQNLTSSAALRTVDRRFAMRLGSDYFALYIEPPPSSSAGVAAAMYWKHTALEAKAQIEAAGGPIYARVEPDGYLAMYQKEGPPADVMSFDTFNHGVHAVRRMTLEPDSNLRAYYWGGSRWVLDYTTITDSCQLPTTCGAYSVCVPPSGQCVCLANATDGSGCAAAPAGNGLCGTTGGEVGGLYWEARRQGVEPANKEWLGFEQAVSAEDCEARCARNCSCWGAVYANVTGYCYLMDYPAQLMVAADERKVGYFKVRSMEEAAAERGSTATGVKAALLAVGVSVLVVAAAFGAYRVWDRRRRSEAETGRQLGADGDGLSPGPYKNLGSFSSVELSSSFNSFRRRLEQIVLGEDDWKKSSWAKTIGRNRPGRRRLEADGAVRAAPAHAPVAVAAPTRLSLSLPVVSLACRLLCLACRSHASPVAACRLVANNCSLARPWPVLSLPLRGLKNKRLIPLPSSSSQLFLYSFETAVLPSMVLS